MREFLAWHSQVFTVTRPSPQWAKRLNWMAASAFCASRNVVAHTRAKNHFFIHSPCLNAAHCTAVIFGTPCRRTERRETSPTLCQEYRHGKTRTECNRLQA